MNTLQQLAASVTALPPQDQKFALSLVEQAKTRNLSDKQWYWVDKLLERIKNPKPVATPAPAAEVGEFQGVLALFGAAKKTLKRPKLQLQMPDGQAVQVYAASDTSKNPGHVYVVSDSGTYLGKVSPAGKWFKTNNVSDQFNADLVSLLTCLAEEPAGTAAAYGKLTGRCSFCSRPLSDERSTEVGYGQHCAKKWGLKWGSKH